MSVVFNHLWQHLIKYAYLSSRRHCEQMWQHLIWLAFSIIIDYIIITSIIVDIVIIFIIIEVVVIIIIIASLLHQLLVKLIVAFVIVVTVSPLLLLLLSLSLLILYHQVMTLLLTNGCLTFNSCNKSLPLFFLTLLPCVLSLSILVAQGTSLINIDTRATRHQIEHFCHTMFGIVRFFIKHHV